MRTKIVFSPHKNSTLNNFYVENNDFMNNISINNNGYDISKFGTFSDNKSAPIHRWFQYPAGFSYKSVEYVLDFYNITKDSIVYDPFAGSGTTNVVCKNKRIQSYGVEAHPFVAKIAQIKVKWDYDYQDLNEYVINFLFNIRHESKDYKNIDINVLPELVKKCYSEDNLKKLLFIRYAIESDVEKRYRDLFEIALISTLREASAAATGWPYIAPKKKIVEKDGIDTFIKQLNMCVDDLNKTPENARTIKSEIVEGDCRYTSLPNDFFDFAFTSPPYLNNYDYSDRTRLETYFMGVVKSWGEISDKIRTKLIMSATTQVVRSRYNTEDIISKELKDVQPIIAKEIQEKVSLLSKIRVNKGGKKSYDILVGQYFNDITLSLIDTYRIMKPNTKYLLILGDSAPYGVHIPTEKYIGEIGLGVGFKSYNIKELRKRGDKWKDNPQRHHTPLRESILILNK